MLESSIAFHSCLIVALENGPFQFLKPEHVTKPEALVSEFR